MKQDQASEDAIEGVSIYLNELGPFLANARKETGLTLREVEGEIGLSRVTIHNYEKGRIKPSVEKLIGLMLFYGYEISYFLVKIDDVR